MAPLQIRTDLFHSIVIPQLTKMSLQTNKVEIHIHKEEKPLGVKVESSEIFDAVFFKELSFSEGRGIYIDN
jgi:hypothetical protein